MAITSPPIFPAEAVTFLRELRDNNNREWFEEHKQQYIDGVRTPATALVAAIGSGLQTRVSEAIHHDQAINGSGSMMRIYRDTRFSKDKTPYKTNVAMTFWHGPNKKEAISSFGLQITPDNAGLMAGTFSFDKAVMAHYREKVIGPAGHALARALAKLGEQGAFTINGAHYKRTPRGVTVPGDERDGLLLHNALWVSSPPIPLDIVTSDRFVETALSYFQTMAPVHHWLIESLNV